MRSAFLLLEAEIETLKGNKRSCYVLPLYEESAHLARKEEFLHEEALALEKAGYHAMFMDEDKTRTSSTARGYFERSTAVYEAYGSMVKTKQLETVVTRVDEILRLSRR